MQEMIKPALERSITDALTAYAARNGTRWKSKLRTDWERGTYPSCPELEGQIQLARHVLGSRGLAKFSLT